MEIEAKLDGVTHINVYSKGKTELGRQLTNFALSPFVHPDFGKFNSVEGFWYWCGTLGGGFKKADLQRIETLRELHGLKAKELGRELIRGMVWRDPECHPDHEYFRELILEGIRCKLRQNRNILTALTNSTLPLKHYYVFGDKVMEQQKYDWQIVEIDRIRSLMKQYVRNKK